MAPLTAEVAVGAALGAGKVAVGARLGAGGTGGASVGVGVPHATNNTSRRETRRTIVFFDI